MTTTTARMLGVLAAGALAVSAAWAQEPVTVSMNYKPVKVWDYFQPDETWTAVGEMIPIPQRGEPGFVVDNDSFKLGIDTDGNGRTDHDVKGVAGFALLKSKDADGESFKYAVRIRKGTSAWEYASSGVYTGKLLGETLTLIDQDGDGRWNEVGVDAMVVGGDENACYLSSVVNLGGALYTLEVAADGGSVTATPYLGESGILSAAAGFETKGELIGAVFSSRDGRYSFDLSRAKDGLRVPVGDYQFDAGFAVRRSERVRIRRGQMRPVHVAAEAVGEVVWGGPLTMRFGQTRNDDDEVTVEPPTFWGTAGEEYFDFFPGGRSPEIVVVDADGKEVWTGKFCES